MGERIFRKPSARELLLMQGITPPGKIREKDILHSIHTGMFISSGNTYEEAVRVVERISDHPGKFVLFTGRFRVPREDSDYSIKSLDDLVKIDSQDVLRTISKEDNVPSRLTSEFAIKYRVWPVTLIKTSMNNLNHENPPMGFYWVGSDGHARATTWLRATSGVEMRIMAGKGDFYGEIIDKKPYGRNLRVKVRSRTKENKFYEFGLFRLPMHSRGDAKQYSDWINMSHTSNDPDSNYRGGEHQKRTFPVYVWSAPTIFAFYNAAQFVQQLGDFRQFRINPFPIPTNEAMINFIDNLRLRSFILHQSEDNQNLNLDVLNKSEMDRIIGARSILRRYENCWHHWGKRDLNYLYSPGN